MPASRWRTRVLLPAVVLALFAGVLLYAARDALLPAMEVRVAPVISKSVSGSAGSVAFQAAGWVEADPFSSYASALTDGVLKEVLVLEGQRVTAGQIVARLIDDEAKIALARAEADVRQRQAELRAAEATLAAAKAQWDNPVERERAVAVAESMLLEIQANIAKREGDVAVEKARADELRDTFARETELSRARAVAEGQRIQTGLRLKTQEALIASTEADVQVLSAKLKTQQAERVAANENLRLRIIEKKDLAAAEAALQQAQAALDTASAVRDDAKLRLERMDIRAPISGVVQERFVEPGTKMMLSATEMNSNHALRIYDPEKLQVRVDVPLADAARVGAGQDATLVVDVLRDTTFKGKVTRILDQADIQKNTLQVKVAIEKPVPELKPEMLARMQFIAAESKSGTTKERERLFALSSTLQRDGAKATVWIVDKGAHIAQHKSVSVGSGRQGDWVEITDGLQPGDALIAGDTSKLREGERVRIIGEVDAPASSQNEMGGDHAAH